MVASYDKLWKLLIDKKIKKMELCKLAHISHTTLAKLNKGENVNTDNLIRICGVLKCDIGDIMEVIQSGK